MEIISLLSDEEGDVLESPQVTSLAPDATSPPEVNLTEWKCLTVGDDIICSSSSATGYRSKCVLLRLAANDSSFESATRRLPAPKGARPHQFSCRRSSKTVNHIREYRTSANTLLSNPKNQSREMALITLLPIVYPLTPAIVMSRISKSDYSESSLEVLGTKFPNFPKSVINAAFTLNKKLYAPTYIHLHNVSPDKVSRLKRPRGPPRRALEQELRSPSGQEVSLEIAWVEEYLESQRHEQERKRRKKQEEDDAEAARQLNFKEHEESGGLLEWSRS